MGGERVTPYYVDDLVTLYLGDCREVLPSIDEADVALVLTDPPYGMDYKPLRGSNGSKMWGDTTVAGDAEPFDPSHLLRFPRLILFGANFYAHRLPPSGGWLVWDKTPHGIREGFIYSHAELAWTNVGGARVRKFSLEWQGNVRNGEPFLHPTQKPVALMRWCIREFTKRGDLVLDPYMGSGPVAKACAEEGRRYIGCEIKVEYLDAAIDRLRQTALDFGGVA